MDQTSSSLPQPPQPPYGEAMEARVAVLEQIAKDTKEILVEMKLDLREMRKEFRQELDSIRKDARTDFRLLFGAIITVALGLSGLLAHGFRWF